MSEPAEKFKIFVSSTTQDLTVHRERVRDLITAMGFVDIAMENWSADARPTVDVITKALNESDVYVGVFGFLYGERLRRGGISFTEFEYQVARERGIPTLLYLLDPEHLVKVSDVSIGRDGLAVKRLRSKIERDKTVTHKRFGNEWDLARNVVESLSEIIRKSVKYLKQPVEEQAILELRRLTREDFAARTDELEGADSLKADGEWFVAGMARCNVGRFYIEREAVRNSTAGWFFESKTPFLFLTGESGIGKTNFLIQLIDRVAKHTRPLAQRAALILPLGKYDPALSFPQNIEEFLRHHQGRSPGVTPEVVASLIKKGDVLLILDGLDEFARVRSADQCARVFDELERHLDLERSRIIVSCRDHIDKRLRRSGLFADEHRYTSISVPVLTKEEVAAALRNRIRIAKGIDQILGAVLQKPLLGFAQHPLVLEMMCRFKKDSWIQLLESRTKGHLYDLWFEEIIEAGADELTIQNKELISETRAKVGKIAALMLQARSDLIAKSTLEDNGIPLADLQALTRQPFGILVQETSDEWGFVHGSFREFALAKVMAEEFVGRRYDLLASRTQLDYVGAEPQQFLRDLFWPKEDELFSLLEDALNSRKDDGEAWSNIVWNVFETIGNIGKDSAAARFIDRALSILDPRKQGSGDCEASYRAQQNIARCLERLHQSAPRPYCDYVVQRNWTKEPDQGNFGAQAIRGFHVQKAHPGYFPPMSYLMSAAAQRDRSFKQAEVSDCLLTVLEHLAATAPNEGKTYLEINCTVALIRWLHRQHELRAKALLRGLCSGSRGNLFQAFLRFGAHEVFRESSDLFEEMTLSWCRIDQSMIPEDFVFRRVRFEHYKPEWITVAPQALVDCVRA